MFKVGDEVVCVDAMPVRPVLFEIAIKTGGIYRVIGMGVKICRPSQSVVRVNTGNYAPWRCSDCGMMHNYEDSGYSTWRFVKLPKQTVEHEERAEA